MTICRAVTVVELPVVFAILSTLLGLLLPTAQAAREHAKKKVKNEFSHKLYID